MKEIIELIIAFLVIMSVLVGFLYVTSTTGTTHSYNLPSSIVQAFAYDTEYLLSGHDLYDLKHPENIFNTLDELYPELHYRITIQSLYIQSLDNVVYLNNSNEQYLEFAEGNTIARVCPVGQVNVSANVTLVVIKTPDSGSGKKSNTNNGSSSIAISNTKYMDPNTGCIVFDENDFDISYRNSLGKSGRSVIIAIIKTSDTIYVAYDYKRTDFLESYFTFYGGALTIMIPKNEHINSFNDTAKAYMIVLDEEGNVRNVTIYLNNYRVSNYIEYIAYWDQNFSNPILNVDGQILAIVPIYPQKLIKPGSYNVIVVPPLGAPEGFPPIVYGSTPPEDFPVSTYQYVTYIDGVPVLVTVEVWRASA